MLEKLTAWAMACAPELSACEAHRPQRAGHAHPSEPYATLYVASDTRRGRPSWRVDSGGVRHYRERRVARVVLDVWGEAAEGIARKLEMNSYSSRATYLALDPVTVSEREFVLHPTAQNRCTLTLTVQFWVDSESTQPYIVEVDLGDI
jgi:hypothetical protein